MSPPGPGAPEQAARERIDAALGEAGWVVQNRATMNLSAGRGVAVREFPLTPHGFVDYMLFVDGKAVGVLEAKPAGHTLAGVEVQARHYADGLPVQLRPPLRPLPFLYLSAGEVTRFTNLLDPDPRSRRIFQVHYDRKRAEYLSQYQALAARAREREGFAPLFQVVVRDNGRPYTRLVLDALDRERITLADVSDYLGVRLKHLDDIAGAVERVGASG